MNVQPRQTKEDKRRRTVRKILIGVGVAAVLLIVLVIVAQRQVKNTFSSTDSSDIQTAQVTVGSIRTTVSGSGTLTSDGEEEVTLPANVELIETKVEVGDLVSEGDVLATVKVSSVRTAMNTIQDSIDSLDDKIEDAKSDTVSSQVTAGVAGRAKAIYGEVGDDVGTVMYNNGCLAIISLDGYMSAEVEGGSYAADDTVTVVTSDGTEYEGTVSEVKAGVATVLITDNGPALGDTVTVDGQYEATLAVHQPLMVTGVAGTISAVNVKENASVSSYTVIFNLTDTSYTANYDSYLEERQELEEELTTLIQMYQTGAIYAPMDGYIDSIEEEDEDREVSTEDTVLLTMDPNTEMKFTINVDETDILSLAVGQEVSVEIESIGDDTYAGTVTQIDKTPTSSGGVTMYTATITLAAEDGMLAGMSADASVTIEGTENALLLPADAVRKTSTSAYVYTSYDEEEGTLGGMTEVTVGLDNGSYVEITSGLSEGDTVYYEEQENTFSFTFGGMSSGGDFGGGADFSGGGDMGGGGGGGMPSGGGGGFPG